MHILLFITMDDPSKHVNTKAVFLVDWHALDKGTEVCVTVLTGLLEERTERDRNEASVGRT